MTIYDARNGDHGAVLADGIVVPYAVRVDTEEKTVTRYLTLDGYFYSQDGNLVTVTEKFKQVHVFHPDFAELN